MISKSIVNIYIYINQIAWLCTLQFNNITLEQKWVKQEVEKKKKNNYNRNALQFVIWIVFINFN